MDIKDIVGLSKPLTRLIEVISSGIGGVSRAYLIRRNAEAKAHEVRVIAAALKDVAEQHHLPVVFKDGEIEIWQKPDDHTLSLEVPDNTTRTNLRLEYQERKRQSNLESITSIAAAELSDETDVPDEKPDEDWTSRFFNSAQDVSSEQMQELWGQILAGEITKPGSYSLKTLDFVRNLTKDDASILERVSKFAITYKGMAILATGDPEWLKTQREIYPGHHFAVGELGAMYPTDLNYRVFSETTAQEEVFVSGKLILLVGRGTISEEIQLPVWSFTKIGKELLQLIPPDGDEGYLENLGRFFLARNGTAKLARILEHLPTGQIRYEVLRDISVATPDAEGQV
jgi:hypothetical protein